MPMIYFYILETAQIAQWLNFICSLLEKIYAKQLTVWVYAPSLSLAVQLDELLWTYREDSFLPHYLCAADHSFPVSYLPLAPIVISDYRIAHPQPEVLVNLTHPVPTCYAQSKRIIEIIYQNVEMQQLARERFQYYRSQGHLPQTIKLQR